jgi:hypothetical protein
MILSSQLRSRRHFDSWASHLQANGNYLELLPCRVTLETPESSNTSGKSQGLEILPCRVTLEAPETFPILQTSRNSL